MKKSEFTIPCSIFMIVVLCRLHESRNQLTRLLKMENKNFYQNNIGHNFHR